MTKNWHALSRQLNSIALYFYVNHLFLVEDASKNTEGLLSVPGTNFLSPTHNECYLSRTNHHEGMLASINSQ